MLHCKVTDADMFFISENTTGGTDCAQDYDKCHLKYQYLYSETSAIEIKALQELECPIQKSYFRKFSVTSVFHCIILN